MKKFFKLLGIFFLTIIILSMVTCSVLSKKLPEGIQDPKTEQLIQQMWTALDKSAWDSTRYVKWSFRGAHHYIWDKESNLAQITWKKNKVLLNPNSRTGKAYIDNQLQEEPSSRKLIDKAWSFWCNDMFWLSAPFKVKDPGTIQELVKEENEKDRLKITYSNGGVTPGDSYVWTFDDNGVPTSYEMYVKIIPIKGIEVPWTDWITISTGAKLSSAHTIAGTGLFIENIAGGMELKDVGLEKDIWAEIR